MRTRRWLGRTALLTLVALAGCGKPPVNEYAWPEARCKVSLPGVVKDVSPTQSDLPALKIKGAGQKGGAYLLSYVDLPKEDPPDGVFDECIRGALASQRESKKFGEERPCAIKDEPYPGREWGMEFRDAEGERCWLRGRVYIVGKRLYQVWAVGTSEAFVRSKEADDYLNSFALLK